jgi:regulation of enolase protein 1 (concanavalin A-like superfamily)
MQRGTDCGLFGGQVARYRGRVSEISVPGLPFVLQSEGGRPGHPPQIADAEVVLTASARADLFIDPRGDAERPDAERFVHEVYGDFLFSAHVSVDFRSTFDSGVLIGFIDDEHWFKLCAELDPAGVPRVVSVVTRGVSDDSNAWPMNPLGVHLRLARIGKAIALHASNDGIRWDLVRYFSMDLAAESPIKLGILAQSPAGQGTTATFRDLAFERSTLRETRDGS